MMNSFPQQLLILGFSFDQTVGSDQVWYYSSLEGQDLQLRLVSLNQDQGYLLWFQNGRGPAKASLGSSLPRVNSWEQMVSTLANLQFLPTELRNHAAMVA